MDVHRLKTQVTTRTFLVSYWPDLGAIPGQEIKLGVFGDLRMGQRYALGLIARSTCNPTEIERVGHLARRLVRNPYKILQERYEAIWATTSPQAAFERTLTRIQSSLVFSEKVERTGAVQVADETDDLETAKNWCMDQLRPVLRTRFHTWMDSTGASRTEGREQLAERDEPQAEPLKLAVG